MPKKLNAYRGSLTASQVADGINAAGANAARLAADARLLLDSDRYPTAASIAALSIEESGKISILREIALARDAADLKEAWKRYTRHTEKNAAFIFPDLVKQGARSLEEFKPIFDSGSDHPMLLDHVKQLGLYTDCLGKARWSDPREVVSPSLARMLVETAELLARRGNAVTPREIELWIEYVGPVWKREMSWMKHGLRNWYDAMRREGLSSFDAESVDRFIDGPPNEDA